MADIPTTMRAQLLTGHGGLDKLEYHDDVAVPQAGPGEVLIHVRACGLNNTDINTRTAWYSRSVTDGTTAEGGAGGFDDMEDGAGSWGREGIGFPRIQGADVAGHVVAVGRGAPADLIGKRVLIDPWILDWNDPDHREKDGYFGSEFDGGYADYTKAPAQNVHVIDSDMTDVELATFATSYVTAENMLHQGKVAAGDVVLIPGASGGVGSALIQLCHRRGAKTIALSGASKHDQVAALGPIAVLEREPADLGKAIKDATGLDHVDVVADVVGGPMFGQFLEVLRRGGRYTCAGAIAGPIVEFDLRTFYLKDLVFTGATVVPPGLFANLVGYIAAGEVKPLVAETFALRDLPKAQEMFLAKSHIGNIVIDHTLD